MINISAEPGDSGFFESHDDKIQPVMEFILAKDLKAAAAHLGLAEIRYLVDTYYLMQDQRKRSANQIRDLSKAGEPSAFIAWAYEQFSRLENSVAKVLDYWTRSQPLASWARGIMGIGPVISAGLMAHIDVTKPTAGHIWRFAGLDPTVAWGKGEKRPWNASLKTLCWKIGESFVKVSNNPKSFYGRLYGERKNYENTRNNSGEYSHQASEILNKKNIGKGTVAYGFYVQGLLPPGHIHARAKRWVVKLFLAHYHEKGYELYLGAKPPKPYAISVLGHAHYIGCEDAA